MQRTWYNFLAILLFLVLGFVLNLAVFLTTLLTRSLRTINNEFLCHLSLVGLIGSTIQYILIFTNLFGTMEKEKENLLCFAEQVTGIFAFSTSSCILFSFAFYRFMSIVRPLTILVHVRLNTVRVLLIAPWVIGGFIAFLCNLAPRSTTCRDWSDINRSEYITFFCVSVLIPVLSMVIFFVGICIKTRQNRRNMQEVKTYWEVQNQKSVGSMQTNTSATADGVVFRNPNFSLSASDCGISNRKWNGVEDLTKVKDDEVSVRKSNSFSSSSKRSRQSNSDLNSEHRENSLKSISLKSKSSKNESLTKISPKDATSDVFEDDLFEDNSHNSRNSHHSDELDFIIPQSDSSENFFQDMMLALHKSFRESKHSINSIKSSLFPSNVSIDSSRQLPVSPSVATTQKLTSALTENTRRSADHGRRCSGETTDERTFDSDVSVPPTPTFRPPPPPPKIVGNQAPVKLISPLTVISSSSDVSSGGGVSLELDNLNVTFGQSKPVPPPRPERQTSSSDSPRSDKMPNTASVISFNSRGESVEGIWAPPQPPPVSSIPIRPTSPTPDSMSREFASSISEDRDTPPPQAAQIQPIDRWLLERIMEIEKGKLEQLEKGSHNGVYINHQNQIQRVDKTEKNSSTYSEGYSTTFLLVVFLLLFCVLQVQYAAIVLCHILTHSPQIYTYPSLANDVSFVLHLIYYLFIPVVIIAVCKPVKTVIYARLIQCHVLCDDCVAWI